MQNNSSHMFLFHWSLSMISDSVVDFEESDHLLDLELRSAVQWLADLGVESRSQLETQSRGVEFSSSSEVRISKGRPFFSDVAGANVASKSRVFCKLKSLSPHFGKPPITGHNQTYANIIPPEIPSPSPPPPSLAYPAVSFLRQECSSNMKFLEDMLYNENEICREPVASYMSISRFVNVIWSLLIGS